MPDHIFLTNRMRLTVILLIVSIVLLSCKLFDQSGPASILPVAPTEISVVDTVTPATPIPAADTVAPPTPTQPPPPTPTPVPTEANNQVEVLEYVYSQDFSTLPEEWDLDPYDSQRVSATYQIEDGLFVWRVQAIQGATLWNRPDETASLPEGDFLYTISLEFQPANQPVAGGAIFRVQDDSNFYYAKLSESGEVSVYALQNAEWSQLVGPVQSEHFIAAEMNRLIVVEENGAYEVQVNDYPAISFKDSRFQGGTFGLIVDMEAGTQAVFNFDDVRVMQPSSSGAGMDEEAGRPTLMPLGASYQTFTDIFNGTSYSIDHPYVFVHSVSGIWQQLCLDAPEKLCVSIQPQQNSWASAEAMADEVMTSFSSSVSDYQELHRQSTVTSEGFPAYWVGYTYTREGKALEGSRLFVVAQDAGFDIAAEGEPVMMELYQAVIKTILESFRLKEQ